MEKFKFNGDWEFEMELNEYMESNLNWRKAYVPNQQKRPIKIRMVDFKSYDPDPLKEQENTLNYIINNQSKMIDSLCNALDKINDDYGARTGMRDELPAKMNPQNLGDVLLVKEIGILTEHKEDYAYYEYSCEYVEDLEHGLIIVMHGDRLIEYDAVGEVDYGGVYKDLGENAQSFIATNIKNQEFGEQQIHQVLPKYGKFKPWQKLAMTEYFEQLFRTKNNEKIKELANQEKFDINHRLDEDNRNLTDLAASFGNIEIMDFLIKKGGDFSNSMLMCNYPNALAYLVKQGLSIDYFLYGGGTRLHHAIVSYASALQRGAAKAAKVQEEWIAFYLSVGADPNSLNQENEDYKTVLRRKQKEEVLQFHKIEEKIEALIKAHFTI